MKGAFYTGQYRNVFAELGHSQKEIAQKLKDAFHTVFYGPDDEKFYFEAGDDMGYFEDTGNFDARTEGMSYAMMMCVQMDMKNEFDRLLTRTSPTTTPAGGSARGPNKNS